MTEAPANDNDLRHAFIHELRERIERMSQNALQIEVGRDEFLPGILADVHGLKGTAAVAGLPDLSDACHNLEGVLNALRNSDSVFADGADLNELLAQTVLDFSDYCTEYCDALSTGSLPPVPPSFLSGDDNNPHVALLAPFRTDHGIAGAFDGRMVSVSLPASTTAAEFQDAIANFQKYISSTPRGIVWNIDLSAIRIIDLPMAGELYLLQEMLRERHGIMNLVGVHSSACAPTLLDRMKRRFRIELAD